MLTMITRSKKWFYLLLWKNYLTQKLTSVESSYNNHSDLSEVDLNFLNGKRIHFWVPHRTAGANFILWETIPKVIGRLLNHNIDVEITISDSISDAPYDLIFSFKEKFPDYVQGVRKILVICDEIDRLWPHLDEFDSVVCTSSFELAELIQSRVECVYFLPEIEPDEILLAGRRRLMNRPNRLANSVLWHGGPYTLRELEILLPFFSKLREVVGFESLEIVSSNGALPSALSAYPWIRSTPWSRENLIKVSQYCRLAILPARKSLRNSYLKPASRVRCCYALGVPAIGDSRVPEVSRLSADLGMPIVDFYRTDSAVKVVAALWADTLRLDKIANSGYEFVKKNNSIEVAISNWIRVFRRLI